ncbi:heme exporter protein CcmD [Pseudomonas aeruginosa]|nr:heme exporter protein CcmD [Pseudomonas aeruginosa]
MGHHGPYVLVGHGISLLVLAINVAEPRCWPGAATCKKRARRLRREAQQ